MLIIFTTFGTRTSENMINASCQTCLGDPLGCLLNPIVEEPSDPVILAAVSATTFLGGVAGVGALRSLGGDKYKDAKKDDDDDDGKKYWEEEDPKSKSFDKIIEFKKNELDKMFNFKKNKADKLIKLKKDKLFFPLLPKLKGKVDKIKDAVKGGKDGKDKKDPVDIQINTGGAEEAAGGGVSLTLSSGHISGTNIILVNGGQDTEAEGEEEVSRSQVVGDSGGLVVNIANSLRGGGLNNTAVIAAARGREEAGGDSGALEVVEMRTEELQPLVPAAEEVRGEQRKHGTQGRKETFLQGSPLKHPAGNQ